jgi:hypothetical protein
MRILFTVPHVFNPSKGGKYGSTGVNPVPRIEAFNRCLLALHQLFGGGQYEINFARWRAVPVPAESASELDIVVLTTRGVHLLSQVNLPPRSFREMAVEVEPMMLEFECQRVLAEGLGRYDYYCFLEDDLVIHDPWFFRKLQWFTGRFGDECLLQPNRFELGRPGGKVCKLYPDNHLKPETTRRFQNLEDTPELLAEHLDRIVRFRRPTNPHAGSYFLNAAQMKRWTDQPHFLDRSTEFIGPLESAASLGIMRAFRIYKADAPHMDFLEIEHHSDSHLAMLGESMPLAKA